MCATLGSADAAGPTVLTGPPPLRCHTYHRGWQVYCVGERPGRVAAGKGAAQVASGARQDDASARHAGRAQRPHVRTKVALRAVPAANRQDYHLQHMRCLNPATVINCRRTTASAAPLPPHHCCRRTPPLTAAPGGDQLHSGGGAACLRQPATLCRNTQPIHSRQQEPPASRGEWPLAAGASACPSEQVETGMLRRSQLLQVLLAAPMRRSRAGSRLAAPAGPAPSVSNPQWTSALPLSCSTPASSAIQPYSPPALPGRNKARPGLRAASHCPWRCRCGVPGPDGPADHGWPAPPPLSPPIAAATATVGLPLPPALQTAVMTETVANGAHSWADEPEPEASQQAPPCNGSRGGASAGGRMGGGRRGPAGMAKPPRPDDSETRAIIQKLQETSGCCWHVVCWARRLPAGCPAATTCCCRTSATAAWPQPLPPLPPLAPVNMPLAVALAVQSPSTSSGQRRSRPASMPSTGGWCGLAFLPTLHSIRRMSATFKVRMRLPTVFALTADRVWRQCLHAVTLRAAGE